MKVRDIDLRSYFAVQSYLNGKFVRKIAHNTYAVERDGHYEITYHGHTIARFYPTHVTVNSCGYKTVTTKQRLNCLIPSQFGIYQENYEWYVWDRKNDSKFTFHDGMVFEY